MQPMAIGVAGVILLVFNTTLGLDAVGLAFVFLAVAIPWFWSIFALARRYPLVMSEALRKRALGESTTVLFDASAVNLLRQSLRQPQSGPALYALSQLEQITPESWPDILAEELPHLLQHPAAEVRLQALKYVLRLQLTNSGALLRGQLEHETEPRVKAMLIRVLAALQEHGSVDLVAAALKSPERIVQAGAIVGLLSTAGTGASAQANDALKRLVGVSSDVEDRRAACDILAELAASPGRAYLAGLLGDPALIVRHAAFRAGAAAI